MFTLIKSKVQEQFELLKQYELFEVQLDKNELFNAYIQALPEEERASHICNCCRSFLNNYGGIIAITPSGIKTLWDFEVAEPYNYVPAELSKIVSNSIIDNRFVPFTKKLGTDFNHQAKDDIIIKWEHFFIELPKTFNIVKEKDVATVKSTHLATKQVVKRGLDEITLDALNTVIDLINEGNLYRGEQFLKQLVDFKNLKQEYVKLDEVQKDVFAWKNAKLELRLRNTSIGTLLVDLSEDRDLEVAVKAYENMVAPSNYKRPTALVTKAMLAKAQETVEELGLSKALERRYATKEDISADMVRYVDRSVVADNVFAELAQDLTINPKTLKNVTDINIDDFFAKVVPEANNIEVFLEARHVNNFMSLIAPVHEYDNKLLKTANDLSWVYKDNMADSLKQKVKNAGGSIEGELRISLEWFNFDDLDLHVIEPNGCPIYYRAKSNSNRNGTLDVDMNAGNSTTREAVENIIFKDKSKMQEGIYKVNVNNFRLAETIDRGYNVEVEHNGEILTFSNTKGLKNRETETIVEFKYSKITGLQIIKGESSSTYKTKNIYGIDTNKFHKVSMVLDSPNYLKEYNNGNKHLFFIIDSAINNDTPRGFFNELLVSDLEKHRKVFEVLGSKLKVPFSDKQLTGLGFSSTIRNDVVFRVTNNKKTQLFNINF